MAQIVRGQATPVTPPVATSPAGSTAVSTAPGVSGKASPQAISLGNAPQPKAVTTGKTTHVVQPGETLYRVAVNNGLRYQDLAEWNNLDGYTIKVGQTLRLTPPDAPRTGVSVTIPPAKPAETKPANGQVPVDARPAAAGQAEADLKRYPKALKQPYSEEAIKSLPAQSEGNGKSVIGPAAVTKPDAPKMTTKPEANPPEQAASQPNTSGSASGESVVSWMWPTQGSVIRGFSDQNKGVDIAGKLGQPILAAADGKVVYSGNGLRGYGKLIILRHDKTFLSAYAHNNTLLVKEGQTVKKGQKIAEMGNSDADQVKLHFEIRKLGKPVDPSSYLETRP